MSSTIDTYLTYLRDVRRLSPNTVVSYARDLAGLAAFAEGKSLGKQTERLSKLPSSRRRLRPIRSASSKKAGGAPSGSAARLSAALASTAMIDWRSTTGDGPDMAL